MNELSDEVGRYKFIPVLRDGERRFCVHNEAPGFRPGSRAQTSSTRVECAWFQRFKLTYGTLLATFAF